MTTSIFISRLRGLPVLDSTGEQVGKVRDVVCHIVTSGNPPRVKGLVVELFGRQRIFVPMVRIHKIDTHEIVITGLVDARKFARRMQELLLVDELFDRDVTLVGGQTLVIYDVAIAQQRAGEWLVREFAVQEHRRSRFGKRGSVRIVDWNEVAVLSLAANQDTAQLVAEMEDMRPADVARELHDMDPERRAEVADALDDETLADALEELPEDEQIELISSLEPERAADILEEMDPDDAADLIADLTPEKAEELLLQMEPEDAQDVRNLLLYAEFTAGGMMTPEPIIMGPDETVATALAKIRREEFTPALASVVFVTRSPRDTPTGRYLGGVHFQQLLREPPSTPIGTLLDATLESLPPDADLATVSRYFATYNLVIAPIVDGEQRLLGAVTVDDVLDHMLPDDWRGQQMDEG